MRRALVPALVVLAAAPGVAAAAPPWSEPVQAGTDAPQVPLLDAQYAGGDAGLLFASRDERPGHFGAPVFDTGELTVLDAAGTPGSSRRVASVDVPPARYGDGRVLFARTAIVAGGRSAFTPVVRIGWSVGWVSRRQVTVGTVRTLRTAVLAERPVLRANQRGDAVLAWIEQRGGQSRLVVSLRRAGGRFGKPRVVRGGFLSGLDAAIASDGRWALAYQHSDREGRDVEVRRGTVRSGPRAGVDVVGPSIGMSRTAVVVADGGRTTVAWVTQDLGEEANDRQRVHAAVLPRGASRFRAAQELDRTPRNARPGGELLAAADGAGRVTLAFTTADAGGAPRARTAQQDAAARFTAVQDLGPGETRDLAVDAHGRGLVAISGRDPDHRDAGVRAAVRPPGGAFSAPQEVSGERLGSFPRALAVFSHRSVPVVGFVRGEDPGAHQVLTSHLGVPVA